MMRLSVGGACLLQRKARTKPRKPLHAQALLCAADSAEAYSLLQGMAPRDAAVPTGFFAGELADSGAVRMHARRRCWPRRTAWRRTACCRAWRRARTTAAACSTRPPSPTRTSTAPPSLRCARASRPPCARNSRRAPHRLLSLNPNPNPHKKKEKNQKNKKESMHASCCSLPACCLSSAISGPCAPPAAPSPPAVSFPQVQAMHASLLLPRGCCLFSAVAGPCGPPAASAQ